MDDKLFSIPYAVYEGEQARGERIIKRLIVALIIVTSMLFASNIFWLHAWAQYDYEDEQILVHTDSGGDANYIGNDGDIHNGDYIDSEETAY